MTVSDNRLINEAQTIAASLSHSDELQGAAKRVIHELTHRLGTRTGTIRRSGLKLVFTTLYGQRIKLTAGESLLWLVFGVAPKGKRAVRRIS